MSEWREGECMNWACHEDGTVTCWRCEQPYCEKHRDHFCCAGHDEWNMTCMCENAWAEAE